jgi:hypothetical protein
MLVEKTENLVADHEKKGWTRTNKYRNLHWWVKRRLGRPNKCDECGNEKAKRYDWANKSGKYLKDISDWVRLCTKCHYDKDKWILKSSKMKQKMKVKKILGNGKFEIFESVRDAQRSVGIDNPHAGGLSNHLNGRNKSYKGFIWERVTNE